MRLFEAKDLTKKYDKTVLNHLDFSIDEGEVVGIIGVSGCGKSSLARLVSGIEKPSSGSLLYQGKTVDFKKSRKDIQLILQNPIESFSPRMKIKQFLYEPYHYFYHLNKKEVMTAIKKILEQVGMDEACLGKYPHELSGGMLQRIMIGIAIILKPKLIIADEPTTAIDSINQKDIIEEFILLKKNLNVSILFVSHDLGILSHIADNLIVMKEGKIVESGTTEEIIYNFKHEHTKFLIETKRALMEKFKKVKK